MLKCKYSYEPVVSRNRSFHFHHSAHCFLKAFDISPSGSSLWSNIFSRTRFWNFVSKVLCSYSLCSEIRNVNIRWIRGPLWKLPSVPCRRSGLPFAGFRSRAKLHCLSGPRWVSFETRKKVNRFKADNGFTEYLFIIMHSSFVNSDFIKDIVICFLHPMKYRTDSCFMI